MMADAANDIAPIGSATRWQREKIKHRVVTMTYYPAFS
jgi:hypothetical protein